MNFGCHFCTHKFAGSRRCLRVRFWWEGIRRARSALSHLVNTREKLLTICQWNEFRQIYQVEKFDYLSSLWGAQPKTSQPGWEGSKLPYGSTLCAQFNSDYLRCFCPTSGLRSSTSPQTGSSKDLNPQATLKINERKDDPPPWRLRSWTHNQKCYLSSAPFKVSDQGMRALHSVWKTPASWERREWHWVA